MLSYIKLCHSISTKLLTFLSFFTSIVDRCHPWTLECLFCWVQLMMWHLSALCCTEFWSEWLDYIILLQADSIIKMQSNCDTAVLPLSTFCCLWVISMSSPGSFSLLFSPQEQEFLQKQQQDLDGALKKIIQQHKVEIATIERDCLNHKQQFMRGRRLDSVTALFWSYLF